MTLSFPISSVSLMVSMVAGFAPLFHGLGVGLKLEQVQSSLRLGLFLKCLPQRARVFLLLWLEHRALWSHFNFGIQSVSYSTFSSGARR